MIPLMGLTICFYIAMRGFDWIIVSKEAHHSGTFYGRMAVGIVTVLGALAFGLMWLTSGVTAPTYPTVP